jgi:hypothetical protein
MTEEAKTQMLRAALWYSRKGWPVFPCHTRNGNGCSCGKADCQSPAKHPRTVNGLRDATTDEEIIKKWWSDWPNANIGLATGSPSGVFFLDVDPRHGGDETLEELENKFGPLPRSIESLTGGGGRHIGFACNGHKIRNSAGKLGPGLDIRADGGYVILSPSVHISGQQYLWEVSSRPNEITPAPPPEWLLKLISEKKSPTLFNSSSKILHGGRNNHLASLAGSMRHRGMSQGAITAALLQENQGKCEPPLNEEEVERIAGSISRYPPAEKALKNDLGVVSEVQVELVRGNQVKLEPVDWVWNGWLASGKMHILAGDIGTGKTTCALALAATITTGGRWPSGDQATKGNVLIWSGEDDPSDTLAPRLVVSGADMERVFFIKDVREGSKKRPFDPAIDMGVLRQSLAEITGGVSFMIVDPIVSAVTGDSNRNAETRRSLQPLVDLAAAEDCALLGITHFSKNTAGRRTTDRVNGSLAFAAMARVVMVAAKSEVKEGDEGPPSRLFLRAKSNIGPDHGGFLYDLRQADLEGHPGISSQSVLWGDPIEGNAREILAEVEEVQGLENGALGEVMTWLQELLLEEGGEVERREIMKAAQAMGFKGRTVHRARAKLGLRVEQSGFGKDKRSLWKLGEFPIRANDTQLCQQNKLARLDLFGTNGGNDPSRQSNDPMVQKALKALSGARVVTPDEFITDNNVEIQKAKEAHVAQTLQAIQGKVGPEVGEL